MIHTQASSVDSVKEARLRVLIRYIAVSLLSLSTLSVAATARQISATVTPQARPAALRDVVFRYQGDASVTGVCVAGEFNRWTRDANPMTRQADGRSWSLTLRLKPGVYQYKFVLNGDKW